MLPVLKVKKKAKQSSGERIGLKKENIKKIEFHDSCQKNGKKRSWMEKTRLSLNRTGTNELCINLLCAGSIRCWSDGLTQLLHWSTHERINRSDTVEINTVYIWIPRCILDKISNTQYNAQQITDTKVFIFFISTHIFDPLRLTF